MITTEKLDMPVVIFCGGVGSRIYTETRIKPKPMIAVGEMPLLWHILKMYAHHGFKNFIITLGYKGEFIREFIEGDTTGAFDDFNIVLAETGEDTPTGGRLLRSMPYVKGNTFMCTYGDGVSDVDLAAVVKHHKKYNDIVGTITGVRVPHSFGVISITGRGKLGGYQKHHLMNETINAGFMVLNRGYLDYLTDDMMVEEPFEPLSKLGKLSVYFHDGYFGAVDTYKDLKTLNELWDKAPPWKVWS